MKHSFIKTIVIAGVAMAPVIAQAQSKGAATPETTNPPLVNKAGEDKERRVARQDPETRARNLATMFDRLDADSNGSLSREEFVKMGTRQPRKNMERKSKREPREGEAKEMKKPEAEKDQEAKKAADDAAAADKAAKEAAAKATEKNRTTGTTGGTGSSASGSNADGSANTGTVAPRP